MSNLSKFEIEIPDEVLLDVKIYKDPALLTRRTIVCTLETDPQQGKLALIPFAGELETAMDKEMLDLGELLRASVRGSRPAGFLASPDSATAASPVAPPWQIPVFYGTP